MGQTCYMGLFCLVSCDVKINQKNRQQEFEFQASLEKIGDIEIELPLLHRNGWGSPVRLTLHSGNEQYRHSLFDYQ